MFFNGFNFYIYSLFFFFVFEQLQSRYVQRELHKILRTKINNFKTKGKVIFVFQKRLCIETKTKN